MYQPDFSRDLECLYGLSTMTLKVENLPDIKLRRCVQTCPRSTREMEPTDGQVAEMDREVTWPSYRSPDEPPLGSVLVEEDDGTYWTILSITYREITETWRAHVRNLSIMPSVLNQATLLVADYGKARANEAKPIWKGLFSGQTTPTADDTVTARFQPAGTEAMIRFQAEWQKESFLIYFQTPLSIDFSGGEYRITDSQTPPNRYRILRYWDAARIDRLACATAVRITEGVEFFEGGTPPQPLPAPSFPQL